MQSKSGKDDQTGSSILINIVFALYAQASYSIVKCYYELSKRLGNALVYEENRVGYLTDEMRLMVKTHDEVAACNDVPIQTFAAFDKVLERSTLALCLKTVSILESLSQGQIYEFFVVISSDLVGSVFYRTAQHYHQSIHNVELLFAAEGASISQERCRSRARNDWSMPEIIETVSRHVAAGRIHRATGLRSTVRSSYAHEIAQRL